MIQQGEEIIGFVIEMWINNFVSILIHSDYLKTNGRNIVYSSDEIQERDSVLCSYWCLYYLLEKQNGRPFLDVIRNTKFIFTDQMINHQFLINYFKLM